MIQNMMLEYDVNKDPGIGAFFAGEKHSSELQNSAVQRALQEAQAKNTLDRLQMDKIEHPLKLEGLGYDNEGKRLGNIQTQGKITDEENERRRKATDAFFSYINENPNDPEGAFVYSGVPRTGKFQEFAQAPPDVRQKWINEWRKNKGALDAQKAEHQSGLKREEQRLNNKDIYEREEMKAREATRRALLAAEARAKASVESTKARLAQIPKGMEGDVVRLRHEIEQLLDSPAGSPEQEAIKLKNLEVLEDRLAQAWAMVLQKAAITAAQRQAGGVNIGAASGGQVPVNAPPNMSVPPRGGYSPNDPNRASAPSGVPGPGIKRFDPATGQFVTVPQ